jgi:hypothetical protein
MITGSHWVGLCNPFSQTSGTICSHCGNAFPVKEFVWADTQENLLRYLRRIRSESPILWRLWYWCFGPICGAAMIGILLYFIGPHIPMKDKLPAPAWGAIGAFFGLFLIPYAVTPWLIPRVTGIRFHEKR